jgi:hypothetical protein
LQNECSVLSVYADALPGGAKEISIAAAAIISSRLNAGEGD